MNKTLGIPSIVLHSLKGWIEEDDLGRSGEALMHILRGVRETG